MNKQLSSLNAVYIKKNIGLADRLNTFKRSELLDSTLLIILYYKKNKCKK